MASMAIIPIIPSYFVLIQMFQCTLKRNSDAVLISPANAALSLLPHNYSS